ncbi:Uncharacterised protein [Vibrio cholerae]|nr:Uncharacterised protein [Vibrio cholerae]
MSQRRWIKLPLIEISPQYWVFLLMMLWISMVSLNRWGLITQIVKQDGNIFMPILT